MPIFANAYDYKRFIETIRYYQLDGAKPRFSLLTKANTPKAKQTIVEIICFCLMPNHFHFLLKQTKNNGISEFLGKLSNSYTRYFNTKHKRVGPLFQGVFKAIHIDTNEQLLHLSRYIHLNPLVGFLTKDLELYRWSSYLEYTRVLPTNMCSKEIILDQFPSRKTYKQFVIDQEDYGKKLEIIKHQLIDFEK